MKLLVDAVQSSRFITAKKSNELIKKLSALTRAHQSRGLMRQVVVTSIHELCISSINHLINTNLLC